MQSYGGLKDPLNEMVAARWARAWGGVSSGMRSTEPGVAKRSTWVEVGKHPLYFVARSS